MRRELLTRPLRWMLRRLRAMRTWVGIRVEVQASDGRFVLVFHLEGVTLLGLIYALVQHFVRVQDWLVWP